MQPAPASQIDRLTDERIFCISLAFGLFAFPLRLQQAIREEAKSTTDYSLAASRRALDMFEVCSSSSKSSLPMTHQMAWLVGPSWTRDRLSPHTPFVITIRLQRSSSLPDILLRAESIRAFSKWEGNAAAQHHQEWTSGTAACCSPPGTVAHQPLCQACSAPKCSKKSRWFFTGLVA